MTSWGKNRSLTEYRLQFVRGVKKLPISHQTTPQCQPSAQRRHIRRLFNHLHWMGKYKWRQLLAAIKIEKLKFCDRMCVKIYLNKILPFNIWYSQNIQHVSATTDTLCMDKYISSHILSVQLIQLIASLNEKTSIYPISLINYENRWKQNKFNLCGKLTSHFSYLAICLPSVEVNRITNTGGYIYTQ